MEQIPSWEAKNVLSCSRNSPHFTEPEGSSPYTQQPATCPYPEPDQSSLHPPPNLSKIHFNIVLPSTLGSSKWSDILHTFLYLAFTWSGWLHVRVLHVLEKSRKCKNNVKLRNIRILVSCTLLESLWHLI
jgi:hypothetical protein